MDISLRSTDLAPGELRGKTLISRHRPALMMSESLGGGNYTSVFHKASVDDSNVQPSEFSLFHGCENLTLTNSK